MLQRSVTKCILLVLIPLLIAAQAAWGEPRYDEHGELIRPQAKKFSGVLQSIRSTERGQVNIVVIDDSKYLIDEKTVFATSYGTHTSLASFKPEMAINFYAVKQLLTKMWPSSQKPEDASGIYEDVQQQGDKRDELRLEDGVWKN